MSIRSSCHHGEGGCRDQHLTIWRTTPCQSATKWDHNFHFKQHQVPNPVENVYEHGRHAWNLPPSPPRGDVALRSTRSKGNVTAKHPCPLLNGTLLGPRCVAITFNEQIIEIQ